MLSNACYLVFVSCVKYVRTMLVMRTPYTPQSKACVWCCYHGGHATTLSCHMNVFVHGHSRPYFDVTCVASHRMSLRQSALRAPQPNFKRAQSSPSQNFRRAQEAPLKAHSHFSEPEACRDKIFSPRLRQRTGPVAALHSWEKKENRSHRINSVIS